MLLPLPNPPMILWSNIKHLQDTHPFHWCLDGSVLKHFHQNIRKAIIKKNLFLIQWGILQVRFEYDKLCRSHQWIAGISTGFYIHAFFQVFVALYNAKQLNDKVAHIYVCLVFWIFFSLKVRWKTAIVLTFQRNTWYFQGLQFYVNSYLK